MKKSIKNCLFLFVALFAFSIPFNSFAGWEYRSVESFDMIDGRAYIVSHCQDQIGDDCTTPGSATRVDVTLVVEVLEGVGMVRRIR